MLPKKGEPKPLLGNKERPRQFASQRATSSWQPKVVEGSERLMELAMQGDPDVFDLALTEESRLRPDIVNFPEEKNGCVPLHVAASRGNLSLIALLIRRNARVNVQDYFGNTPLLYALHRKHNQAAKLLIQNNADIQMSDFRGNTPLHYTAMTENVEMTDLILSRGADPDPLNHANEKPVDKTKYPILQKKFEKASQEKLVGIESKNDAMVNWMGFGIGLGVGLGIALAKQQAILEAQAAEARDLKERHDRALQAAQNERFNPYALKKPGSPQQPTIAQNTAANILMKSK